MSKATLSFEIPQENIEFESAYYGHSFKRVIEDFNDWIRTQIKYQNVEVLPLEEVRSKLWEIVKENEIERLFS